jgi:endonuclease/exonuclease/phosphatase family metal-dependent hydrolase
MILNILTFNVWHGLNGRGTLAFGEFETPVRRRLRQAALVRELADVRADMVCLQEVNPLLPRSRELGAALGASVFTQGDQAGIKVLGFGIPYNLNTGLCTLVRRDWLSSRAGGVKLSGGLGQITELGSFQLGEFRYALAVHVEISGHRFLLVNQHLHHGFEWSAELEDILEAARQGGEITSEELEAMRRAFVAAGARRELEVEGLLRFIEKHSAGCVASIVCGDLNSPPCGRAYHKMIRSGFTDLQLLANGGQEPPPSWDPKTLVDNHTIVEGGFAYPFPDFGRQSVLHEIYRRYDRKPRRIDYVFWRSLTCEPQRVSARLLGAEPVGDGMHLSDHLGVLVSVDLVN